MNRIEIPTQDQFHVAVLAVLAEISEGHKQEIKERVFSRLQVSEVARNLVTPEGNRRIETPFSFSLSALTIAKLTERTGRGIYRITDAGRKVAARNLTAYSEKDMEEWPAWASYWEEKRARIANSSGGVSTTPAATEDNDPYQTILTAEQALRSEVETELRRRLQESSPEFFERAVIELLWAMGYGGEHGKKRHVGQSNDGGIDGIIQQDALGLSNVYIQAKRYADNNSVGGPTIQQFIGALAVQNADRGVFITSSTFTAAAKEAARKVTGKNVVLIDGIKLTSLMVSYGIGVRSKRNIEVFEIDDEFFDDI